MDEETALSTASKDDGRLRCTFAWSDAEGNEVPEREAMHLAVVISAAEKNDQHRAAEQKALVTAIETARDGSFEDLAMFNH